MDINLNAGLSQTQAHAFSLHVKADVLLAPGLYVVATPIGNLGDITLRALQTLSACDVVACEDTRMTGKLLAHFGINARVMVYSEHTAEKQRPALLRLLEEKKRVALVSDAGTPLICDPGFKLVQEARTLHLPVFTVPGASSIIAALSIAGLASEKFYFGGFLPAKSTARRKAIAALSMQPGSIVLLEAPHRLREALIDLAEGLGAREAAIARELTKLHEEVVSGTLSGLAERYMHEPARGEIVIIIAPSAPTHPPDSQALDDALTKAMASHSLKDAARIVALEYALPRNTVYARALTLAKS